MTFFILDKFGDALLKELPEVYREVFKQSRRKDGEITFVINSPGGYASVLKSYLDAVETAKDLGVTVTTFVTGRAASAGSLFAAAGSKGHRFISPSAYHMIHQGSAGAYGETDEGLLRDAQHGLEHFEYVHRLYKYYAKVPQLRKKMAHDNLWVNADTAVEWKLADHCGVPHF